MTARYQQLTAVFRQPPEPETERTAWDKAEEMAPILESFLGMDLLPIDGKTIKVSGIPEGV